MNLVFSDIFAKRQHSDFSTERMERERQTDREQKRNRIKENYTDAKRCRYKDR